MSEQAQRYPLAWPSGWKRSPSYARQQASFGRKRAGESKRRLNLDDAFTRLDTELDRLGATDAVVSTNLKLRLDGRPRGDQGEPGDCGVALYFRLKKADRCLACDRYYRVADNIAAIAAHIEALRAIERYGVGTLDQAFAGYAALPANAAVEWWTVLGVLRTATPAQVDDAYKRLALVAHPDKGGSQVEMARLNEARDAARKAAAS